MSLKTRLFCLLLTTLLTCESNAELIRYTTWNLQWLANQPHKKLISPNRSENDIRLLREYFIKTSSDVMAFQEVNDIDIISKIVGPNYKIILSHRSRIENQANQFDKINQYTGFAVKSSLEVLDHIDLKLDKRPTSRLRFASYIELVKPSKLSVHLLSVHLKGGCRTKYQNKRSCVILKEQLTNINLWIREREKHHQTYIVLGDFNSQMADKAEWAWRLVSHKTKAILASQDTDAKCSVKSKK